MCKDHTLKFTKQCWEQLNNLGFLCGSAGKESAYSVGDLGSISGLGRSPTAGKGYPLQYSGLEWTVESMGSQSRTRLSDFHFQEKIHLVHGLRLNTVKMSILPQIELQIHYRFNKNPRTLFCVKTDKPILKFI